MTLSYDQVQALDAIQRWYQSKEQVFILAGYAGTGKTTVIQKFILGLDQPAIVCCPTGKAAEVLRSKLPGIRVSTIHRVLYKVLPPPSLDTLKSLEAELLQHPGSESLQERVAEERYRLERNALRFGIKDKETRIIQSGDLCIVDEASMVTCQMLADFLHTGARVLFVGDPGQLPPVQDKGCFAEHEPDVILTSIHRQALDSAVLQLSLRIRAGEDIPAFTAPGCCKAPKESRPYEEWLTFDQILTGHNKTRRRANRFFRKVKGMDLIWPGKGEKLICLKNAEEYFFVNGAQATAAGAFAFDSQMDCVVGQICYGGETLAPRCFSAFPFKATYNSSLVDPPWWERGVAVVDQLDFDYAYAITVHKSQGSEWDRVLLADDGLGGDSREFRRRWLYTAVTRSKKELLWLY